jgi:hypothetical protein
MLVSKLYVPTKCIQGERLVTYLLWPKNQEIEVTLTKPELWDIEELYNYTRSHEREGSDIVFSDFDNNGFIGIVFRIPVLSEDSKTEEIVFTIDDGSGLSEVHKRKVTIVKHSEIALGDCVPHSITSGPQENKQAQFHAGRACMHVPGLHESTTYQQIPEKREVVARCVKDSFARADAIDADLSEEFRIDGKQLTFLRKDKRLIYDLIVVPEISRPLPKTIKFTHAIPFRIAITHLPDLARIPWAVVYTDDGYKIKLRHLTAGERYLVSLEYTIENDTFLDHLVEKTWYSKTVHSDIITNGYDVIALMKYPEILTRDACGVEIRDIEICIEIPVARYFSESDLNKTNSIPDYYFRQLFAQNIEMTQDISDQRTVVEYTHHDMRSPDHARIHIFLDISNNKPAVNGIFFC